MAQYLPVLVLAILAAAFGGLSLLASKLLAPKNTHAAKRSAYESGIVPGEGTPERFPVRFYLIAMIFIVFDIEIIFLYPWAVIYRDLGTPGLVEVVIFAVAVFISFLYLIANGALDWGPVKKARRLPQVVTTELAPGTTVRQVGMEGRPVRAASSDSESEEVAV